MDSTHHVFRATTRDPVGAPTERNESDRIEWIPLADVPGMIARHEILSGITLLGLQQTLLADAGLAGTRTPTTTQPPPPPPA